MKLAKDLVAGDFVDMDTTQLPFSYDDQLKQFEYGVVEKVVEETEDCVCVVFENMMAVAVSPNQKMEIEDD